ncbi:TonB-dependent receptor [Sphingobium sp. HWE2-09]|uniref:TonB-dependent receptor n=1 Tax=Sphingobium sp. HWE2-09 TaxID=3108390 RepID=UPI002DD0B7C0|nr:TonB-dependent receptor [Sphingobium sp. HWE2-09]
MKFSLLLTTSAVALAAIASPAWAQIAAAPTQAADQQSSSGPDVGLADIVVTAQRRAENLQRAAIAVSAVSGDQLSAAGITRPSELTALIPSLQVAPSAGPYNLFYLRGVGNYQGNALSESAIAFTFDGTYIGRPSGTTGFFYDLERVEVVKGPQGTLYGRNATGGAINVISKKPELGKFGASGGIEYGNYDALRVDGMVNAPIGDKAAIRIAGIHVRHDGYMNDDTDDQKDWGLRGSLLFEPTSDLSLHVVGDYFDQGGRGVGATPLLAPNGVSSTAAFSVDDRIGFFSPQGQAFYTSQRANTLQRNFSAFPAEFRQFQNNSTWGVAATLNWESAAGTLTLVPGHRETSLDYRSYTPGFQIRETSKSQQTTFEARFATPDTNPLRALAGFFYFDEGTKGPTGSYVSNWNGQYDANLKADTKSEALFGRLTYAVTPDIRFTVGARQTWEDKSFSGNRLSFTRICQGPPALCANAPGLPFGTTPPSQRVTMPIAFNPTVLQVVTPINANNQADFKKFTWRAGADWDMTSQNLLYASYETGFKAGGFYFSPGTGTYQPEEIEAFTLVSKNRFLDNRLQVNLELFHWHYRDQQISHLVTISGVPTFATENVGRATFKGLELETRFAATPTTMLGADLQYLDAKYNSFTFLQSNGSGIANPAIFNGTGCPTQGFDAPSGNSFRVNCSGQRPPNAPKWTLNLSGQQKVPLESGELVFDARAHYQSRTLIGLEFLPVETQPGYWLADAAITYNGPDRRFYISGFINNMFNETVKSQIFPTPGTQFYGTTLRPPRTYGVRAGFAF